MPKPSKRDQVAEATKELLWEVGYEAVSPPDIQARSAAKPGSLYHHFPSKLTIAEVALGEVAAEEIHVLKRFSADAPPLEAVRRYLLLKRDAFRGCRLGRLVHEASIEHEELRRRRQLKIK
jgi:TetR/AcrR family transcriptional repressor of nem operon